MEWRVDRNLIRAALAPTEAAPPALTPDQGAYLLTQGLEPNMEGWLLIQGYDPDGNNNSLARMRARAAANARDDRLVRVTPE